MGLLDSKDFAAKLIERFTIADLMQIAIESINSTNAESVRIDSLVPILLSVYAAADIETNTPIRDLSKDVVERIQNCDEEMRQFAFATAALLSALKGE